MCVIIDKPEGLGFDEDDLLSAIHVNPEGFGWMYAKEGAVTFGKGLKFTPEGISKFINTDLKDTRALFHFRYNTVGETTQEMCHPFKVLDKRVNGTDMFLMHNGTIYNCKPGIKESKARQELSDTKIFATEILRPLLVKYGVDALDDPFIHQALEEYIGDTSKVVLLNGDGAVYSLNKGKGAERNGCWVSNEYSFNRSHRDPPKAYGGNYGAMYNGKWESSFLRNKREAEEKLALNKLSSTIPPVGKAVVKLQPTVGESLGRVGPTLVVPPLGKDKDTTTLASFDDPPFESKDEEDTEDTYSFSAEVDHYLNHMDYLTKKDIEYFVYDSPDEAVELIYELGKRI